MSDESDIGNISRKNRKRPAHVAVTSDSSDSPLVTTSRSRKPPRIPSDQEEPSDINSVVKKTLRKKKILKLSSESENTDSDESNSSSDAVIARFARKKKVNRLSSGSADIDSSGNDSIIQSILTKKKPSAISSGSNFDSDSDSFNKNVTRKKKVPVLESEGEISSLSSGSSIARLSRRRNVPRVTSDAEASYSEEESSFELHRPNKRAAARVITDDDDDDVSAEEDIYDDTLGQILSDNNEDGMETGSEESDSDSSDESDSDEAQAVAKTSTPTKPTPVKVVAAEFDSSSDSDGQSDKCPICLLRFTTQEIGTPEACDHSFCAECLQEWSKNVNTCPVDRQPFTLILVRRHLEGKVVRQISVDTNRPENNVEDPPSDPTFCEICGASDREDRMLLCDVCDLGYHMECLDPPLEVVPLEEWYCPDCNQNNINMAEAVDFEENELLLLLQEAPELALAPLRPHPAPTRRLVPRTRHSVRVQATMRTRPRQNDSNGAGPSHGRRNAPDYNQPSTSSGIESVDVNDVSGRRMRRTTGEGNQSRRRKNKTRRKNKKKKTGFKILMVDTEDGPVAVKVPIKSRKRRKKTSRRKKRRLNRTLRATPQTVKERLATRLGICLQMNQNRIIPEAVTQPDLRSAPINHQRHQAGIPTLDLFGRHDQLDSFSGSEADHDSEFGGRGEVGIVSRPRAAFRTNRILNKKIAASIFSSSNRRKTIPTSQLSSPSSTNILDSILDSQALWHSKKTEIKSNRDGSLEIKLLENVKDKPLEKQQKLDLSKEEGRVSQVPMYPGGGSRPGGFSGYGYQSNHTSRSGPHHSSGTEMGPRPSYGSSSFSNFGSSQSDVSGYHSGLTPFRGGAPIRFRMTLPPRRPNIHAHPPPIRHTPPPIMSDISFQPSNSPQRSPVDDDEIDIYSDIEQESETREGHEKSYGALEPPPEPPALLMGLGINDDPASDEENGLVIDDPPVPPDMYDPAEPCDDSNSSNEGALPRPPTPPVLQSTVLPRPPSPTYAYPYPEVGPQLPIIGPLPRPPSHHSSDGEDDDEDDDDGCPNFSMYSAASMNLAHREKKSPSPVRSDGADLDIPIPPTKIVEEDQDLSQNNDDLNIPMPESDKSEVVLEKDEASLDIPIPDELNEEDIPMPVTDVTDQRDDQQDEDSSDETKHSEKDSDEDVDEDEDDDDNTSVQDENEMSESVKNEAIQQTKENSNEAEDECSTQGDVLELAIESEANLENAQEENEEPSVSSIHEENAVEVEETEKVIDAGEKPDGLIDITDEEMSVYDGQDNSENIDKLDIDEKCKTDISHEADKTGGEPFESDDDNSLVGGATSAVSAGTLNNSDNQQVSSLPGLEGLETETISESEDVNFDELPEGDQPSIMQKDEEYISNKKKRKKKNRKTLAVNDEDISLQGMKGQHSDVLEFEEGEIIEDKPKQGSKKDKKNKSKHDKENTDLAEIIVDGKKSKTPPIEIVAVDKKQKKKKDKTSSLKEKSQLKKNDAKVKEPKEKTLKPGKADESIAWKKLSKNTKERNYRDGKEKEEQDKAANKKQELGKKEKRNKEKRKELERYDVRRLISEKPKRPRKDEFGRDLSPSKSRSLSPYRPRGRSPLRARNRSRTRSRSRSWRSRSRSRGRRRSRSRGRFRSRDRSRKSKSRDRVKSRSRSRNRIRSRSRDRRRSRSRDKGNKSKSLTRRRSHSRRLSYSPGPLYTRKHVSRSYSRSWTPSFSRSSISRSRSLTPRPRRKSRSLSRSLSRTWSPNPSNSSARRGIGQAAPKNLTVIVRNKDAIKKKEKKKSSKKKDDKRKRKRGQSPAPSKEVFTSGDNILVSVNFKSNRGAEVIPASTPVLRDGSKRKREEPEGSTKRKKDKNANTVVKGKMSQGKSKNNRVTKINEATRNAKPVAIIDLDMSPFREQTPSPKEVIVLSDSDNDAAKKLNEMQNDRLDEMSHGLLTLSMDHVQNSTASQPESPTTNTFTVVSAGPKTPPEPHIKFSIATKQTQMRILSNPLLETEDDMREDENVGNDVMNEVLHKGPNTPPEPPPELNTPASPPTTPYDPFDPTKSRSPSPQPRSSNYDEGVSQGMISREDKSLDNSLSLQTDLDDHSRLPEHRPLTPPNESEDTRKTPDSIKMHSTPKGDMNMVDISPKHGSPTPISTEMSKLAEETLLKPIQKILSTQNTQPVLKSPERLLTSSANQQVIKTQNQTPKQMIQSNSKAITPVKHQPPKPVSAKHQLFTANMLKQIPALALPLLGPAPVYTPNMTLNTSSKSTNRVQQNGDPSDDVLDLDPGSPYSPGSSEGDDLFDPPAATPPRPAAKTTPAKKTPVGLSKFDALLNSSPLKPRHGRYSGKVTGKKQQLAKSSKVVKGGSKKEVGVKLDEDQLKILDELPNSAVEMQVKDKFLKKLNRQERVVEEVKLVLKPHYAKKHINKEEYKEILRRAVPKICHNRSGEINPMKIQFLIEAYVKKFRYAKKKTTGPPPTNSGGTSGAAGKMKIQKTMWS